MNRVSIRAFVRIASTLALAAVTISGATAFAQAAKPAAPAKAPAARAAAFDASACLACHAPVKAFYESGKHKGDRLQRLSRRHGSASRGFEEAAGHEDRPRHLRRLPPEPVQVVRADGLASHGALREEADDRTRARSGVRPADDAARLHAASTTCRAGTRSRCSTSSSSIARSAAASAPRRRWRYLAGVRRLQGLGRRDRPVSRQHRPEGLQAGHRRRGEPGVPLLQDAGPHPRLGVHGRPRAQREVEPHVEGRRARASRSNHALNCIFCHDPHAAKPRIVRDALIEAVTRTDIADAVLAGRAQDEGRRQGHGRARLHAQDRACSSATTASCSAGSATSSTTATPASIRTPARRSRWPTSAPTTSRSSTSTTS